MYNPALNNNIPPHPELQQRIDNVLKWARLWRQGAMDDAKFEEYVAKETLTPGTDDHCTFCKGAMHITEDNITPGLVKILLKMRGAVAIKGVNDIKIHKLTGKLAFSVSEHANFHKLRKHGLVHWVKVNGKPQRGHWLITRKGWEFLDGADIPAIVFTYNDQVVGHSTATTNISLSLQDPQYWNEIDDYVASRKPAGSSLNTANIIPSHP